MSHEYKLNYRPVVSPEQLYALREKLAIPVPQAKIDAINEMLSNPRVNYAWRDYQELPQYHGSGVDILMARKSSWQRYVNARNEFFKKLTVN